MGLLPSLGRVVRGREMRQYEGADSRRFGYGPHLVDGRVGLE